MITILGKVIHGQHYGRVLGFPTANLDRRQYVRQKMKIRFGVYAGWAEIGNRQQAKGKRWKAAIVIGPLDKNQLPKIEAHLVGFKGNLYQKNLIIYLEKFIRPFKKFSSEVNLKRQIKKDIIKVKK